MDLLLRRTCAPIVAALTLLVVSAPALSAQDAVPLRAGEARTATVTAGDTLRYSLDTEPEWYVRASVEQISARVAVRIVRPDDTQLRRVDQRRRGLERFWFETAQEGAYQLQVIPAGDEEEGEFRIRIERLEPVATEPAALAEQILSFYEGPDSPGAGVRVWRDGETLYSRAWGTANLAYGVPFRDDTPTNIGSTSKQFTGFAVMLLVERGLLSLDDDVREYVPELPDFGKTVTVRHLLVHASGYREIFNLLIMAARRMFDGDAVSRDEMIQVVQNQPALQNDPGAEWNYNNTAYGLAALIVERVSEQSFDAFMEENVFGPLGMTRSAVRPHAAAIIPGRTMGYSPDEAGGYQEMRDLGAAVGAGAVYASLEDLQTWVENYHSPRVGTRETVELMMTPFVTTQDDTTTYGLGLMIDEQRGLRRIHHGGADVAHRSMLAYYPEIGAGITVQSNDSGFNSNLAFRLAGAFFADAMEEEPEDEEAPVVDAPFDPASFSPEDFDDFVGRYALDSSPQAVFTISREGDRLLARAPGQPDVELRPTSDSTFAITVVDASITFHRDDDGGVTAMSLEQGGMTQRATRLEDDEEEWEPTADELRTFTGRYFSDEVETFYTIAMDDDDQLVLQHRRFDDSSLSPGERDAFSASGGVSVQITFERDRNGQILGFYMSNQRSRDVRFQRLR
jgi:CubicO group peptidase (beta-lactamase class C family)